MEKLSSSGPFRESFVVELGEKSVSKRSVSLTGGAVFGGLAALSTLIVPARIQPFFFVSFLRFDPAEIFSVLAFLIFGPIAGFTTATAHWLFLTATGSSGPLGPAAKFASVLSTLIGLWWGLRVYHRISEKNTRISMVFASMLSFAAAARICTMLVLNYFIFTAIGPLFGIDYLGGSQRAFQTIFGVQYSGSWLLIALLAFTSVFNGLHAVFSVAIPYLIFRPLSVKIPEIASGQPWISRFNDR